MNILGIDPGSRSCGYGIIRVGVGLSFVDAGLIEMHSASLQDQMLEFVQGINAVLSQFDINSVAIESIFYAYNPKTIIKLAQFRGAIALKILQDFGSFYEYTPLQVKRSVTGNGKASKHQVNFMVRRILNVRQDIDSTDVTDALAVAITHSQHIIRRPVL